MSEEIKQKLRQRVRTKYDGIGIPPVDCVCIYGPDDRDVRIVAHTFVAGKVAAVWQFGDEFGYGIDGQFSIDPDQESQP